MCQKRTRKIQKGSQVNRLREARRIERLRRSPTPPISDNSNSNQSTSPPTVDKVLQNRVILQLAYKTVLLMQKNRVIQQKIVALQKETSEFVASVMKNPENQRRYLEHVRLYGVPQKLKFQISKEVTPPIKVEPTP